MADAGARAADEEASAAGNGPSSRQVRLYNTHTHRVEPLETVEPGVVRLYVCGVSVSGVPHVGHARSYVVFDVLRRVLEHAGYEVRHVQNFTDIEDAITRRAEDAGMTVEEFAEQMVQAYFEQMDRLDILRAHHYPRVTEYIDRIVEVTERLQHHECAYRIPDGVAFRTCDVEDFGGLLGRDPAGAVVDPVKEEEWGGRESPFDFILWRDDDQMGTTWDTPWGKGRPGWHTECAVMATGLLGDTVDIHGGGVDLVFPHHECERAIARCLTGERFANVWVHNGLVTMKREKMSKSLSNFVTLEQAIDRYGPAPVRVACMAEPYRQTLEWTSNMAERATEHVRTLVHALDRIEDAGDRAFDEMDERVRERWENLLEALYRDLDLPAACQELLELAHYDVQRPGAGRVLWEGLDLLGLSGLEPFADRTRGD